MGRSFSTAKLLSSSAAAKAITNGRTFSAAAPKATASVAVATSGGMVKKTGEATKLVSSSWIPDPRTGFYRPENLAEEIDPAQLRALLLKKH